MRFILIGVLLLPFLLGAPLVLFADSQIDPDGDGITGEKDKYPFLAEAPAVSWEIKELIFTWDINPEWLTQKTNKKNQDHLTKNSFSFAVERENTFDNDAEIYLTPNVYKILKNSSMKTKAGVHFAGRRGWSKINQKEIKRCIEAFEFQKTHIKNPHWEITVWIRNTTRKTLKAENLQVPLLDEDNNVITYATPYYFNQAKELLIPAMRNVPIKFRAETDTLKAFEEIKHMKDNPPVFGLTNSWGRLLFQGQSEDQLDIISQIQIMHDQTVPLTFERNGYQLSWRIAKCVDGSDPVIVAQALEQINRKMREISDKPFFVIKNGEIESLAGYGNTDDCFWEVTVAERPRTAFLTAEVRDGVLFRYSFLKRELQTINEKYRGLRVNWQKKIRESQSYTRVIEEISDLLEAIVVQEMLQEQFDRNMFWEYKKNLIKLRKQITVLREKDRADYQKISKAIHAHKYLEVLNHINDYYVSDNHQRVMKSKLIGYQNNFRSIIKTSINLTPSKKFNDKGGGAPDFKIFVGYNGKKYVYYKKGLSKYTEMGKRSDFFTFKTLAHAQKMFIYVVEVDFLKDDKYGSYTTDVTALYDNENVTRFCQCQQDGSITLLIKPTFIPNITLPHFSE